MAEPVKDLNPCPFCGECELQMCGPYPLDRQKEYFVQCQVCTCTGPSGDSKESAEIQWNFGARRVRI